jgi:hypothetical protein
LFTGVRASENALLPDVEPAPWRGVGPYGQGGKGMTGGTPYGRPLADRAPDRDGLALDQLPVRFGPLFAPFPVGLVLDVVLQGDVIQAARVDNAFEGSPLAESSPFHTALREPVSIAELEMARARSHLGWVADALWSHGLDALGERTLRLAHALRPGDGEAIGRLERSLRRSGLLRWTTRGVGRLGAAALEGVTGPVARAAGRAVDARSEDPAYLSLGFEPLTQQDGDASARWLQRLHEARQAVGVAKSAGDAKTSIVGRVDGPRGVMGSSELLGRLPALLEGQEFGDAVTTVVSLDLDMEEAVASAARVAAS